MKRNIILNSKNEEKNGAVGYQFRLKIDKQASQIQITKNQRMLQSPEEIRGINLKKTELNWVCIDLFISLTLNLLQIFNNVKNTAIQK